jgi:hypothetical protein
LALQGAGGGTLSAAPADVRDPKPSDADFLNNPSGVPRDLGRPSDAIIAYRQALRRHRHIAEIYRNLGCARGNSTTPQTACARRFG